MRIAPYTGVVGTALYHLRRPYHFLKTGLGQGFVAQIKHGFPGRSLVVIGITGTDGKSTTTRLLGHIMQTAGIKAATLSTLGAQAGKATTETGLHVTTPQPGELLEFVDTIEHLGFTHLVLEITSQGFHQYRTWGIKPQFVGITNIAAEHLDYHRNYTNYVAAKAAILQEGNGVVLNADDQAYQRLRRALPSARYHVLTYSSQEQLPDSIADAILQRFPEPYNQMNARLAHKLARIQLIDTDTIARAITTFPAVRGRLEVVSERPITTIVDFAHTPQAVSSVLSHIRTTFLPTPAVRKAGRSQLIVVLGAAGRRDASKRPLLGKLAVELADTVLFTSEDPRDEDPWAIIRQMKEQLHEGHRKIISIVDRRDAIRFAINTVAKPGDVVVVLGKGHEQSMSVGAAELPWDDCAEVKKALKRRPDYSPQSDSSSVN
jgi:UDP-N-acetylmuramoyl-L-alanyl-D-glutamate--2,6-diaminopimelate ligase